ncbi:MAG TPA: cytochrome c biogenesis protein CcsA [Methylomirabilota bacterium]|nr:cytochrome c biogenesis protein CcsA [Methylomirabilota bacterium]
MIWWSRGLVDLALTGYLWAAVQALAELAGRRGWPVRTRVLIVSAWAVHTVGLALRAAAAGGPPVGGLHGALSVLVWAAILLLVWGERRYALQSLPAFVLAPAAVLGLIAAAMPEAAVFRGSGGPGPSGHALLIILGLGILAGNFAGALMYVLQERAIKHGRLTGISRRLPPLNALDRFSFHTLVVGFPFLTLGIAVGAVSAGLVHGTGWLMQPTPVVAIATWAIYAVALYLRAGAGWGGRRGAYLAVAGFAGTLAALTVSLLLPMRHVALLGP